MLFSPLNYLQVVCVGQAGAIFNGLGNGLSQFNSITAERLWAVAGRSFLASEILAILALSLAKCSVVLLMHRVFSSNSGWKLWLRIALFALSAVWGFVCMLIVAIGCDADTVLTTEGVTQCPEQVDRLHPHSSSQTYYRRSIVGAS